MALVSEKRLKEIKDIQSRQTKASEKQFSGGSSSKKTNSRPKLRDTSKDVIGYREVTDDDGTVRQQKTNFTAREEGQRLREEGITTGSGRLISAFDKNRKDSNRASGSNVTSDLPSRNNNIQNIQDLYGEQNNVLIAALKQRISESVAGQERIKAQAPQQFDPLRASSEVAKSSDIRSALERSSNLGDRGGVGRSEALATQLAGESRLNQINLAQQNVIDQADAEIARLNNEGRFQEAQIIAGNRAQMIQSLLGEDIRQQGIDREDAIRQENIAREDEALALRAEEAATTQEKADFLATINQFASQEGGFQAEINRIANNNDATDDWKLPFLRDARQGEITGMEQGQIDAKSDAMNFAMDKWTKGIPLTQQEMQLIGATTSTKPRTGGTGGMSTAQQLSLAKWKFDNNQPLTAQEAALIGVGSVYTQPDQGNIQNEIQTIENLISNVPGIVQKKDAVVDYLATRVDDMELETAQEIIRQYDLNESDLDRIAQIVGSVGTVGGTPGGN